MRIRDFWAWTSFRDYVIAVFMFTFALSCAAYIFQNSAPFGSFVGHFALIAESLVSTPQLVANCKRGSTEGLRYRHPIVPHGQAPILQWDTGTSH